MMSNWMKSILGLSLAVTWAQAIPDGSIFGSLILLPVTFFWIGYFLLHFVKYVSEDFKK